VFAVEFLGFPYHGHSMLANPRLRDIHLPFIHYLEFHFSDMLAMRAGTNEMTVYYL